MFRRELRKPDGRALWLYSRDPIPELPAPAPSGAGGGSHLRWHPLRGEWVAYATHRQNRTFLPPAEYNPLAPTTDPRNPTELPAGPYDVAVFENLFATLTRHPGVPPETIVPTAPGFGVCEVVVFTQDRDATLGTLPLWHLELIVDVWADRTAALGAVPGVQYVMPFENKGVEVGVTLHHPHGQIYAYPFVPPVPARELAEQRSFHAVHHRGLLDDHIRRECDDGRRILYVSDEAVAFVPVCARYAYEVWIAPRRPAASLPDLTRGERRELARALKTVLLKFDGLWNRPFPYVMAFHQAPTDGEPHPEAHVHLEIYPPYRMPGRLKHLAGSEIAAGVFTADTLPEQTADELRKVAVSID
ncbi:MAG: galactose-1-phosphate uridylyltransferase [Acidobacteria bacterium]|nr:galactose-1-phosphate uridylyltransferase [Acidobacteriota bacterium]